MTGAEPLPGLVDLLLGLRSANPRGTFDALARLEVLVDLEEVLDLQAIEFRDMVDIA